MRDSEGVEALIYVTWDARLTRSVLTWVCSTEFNRGGCVWRCLLAATAVALCR